jgi:hypothetical protein
MRWSLAISFTIGSLMALTISHPSTAWDVGCWLLGVPIAIVALWVTWKYCIFIWRALNPIFEPVPSPPEIAARLEIEWGRPPTVGEVAAVQTMLVNQRNQQVLNGGLVLGTAYLLGHHDR